MAPSTNNSSSISSSSSSNSSSSSRSNSSRSSSDSGSCSSQCGQLRGYSLGIVFIFIVAVIWAGASVLTQYIYTDLDFQSPFLVTYLSTTLFALYLPLWRLWIWLGYVTDPPFRRERDHQLEKQEEVLFPTNGTYQTPQVSSRVSKESDQASLPLFSSSTQESNGLLEKTAEGICSLLSSASSNYEAVPPYETDVDTHNTTHTGSGSTTIHDNDPPHHYPCRNSHEEVMVIALKVAPLWFLANCGYNYSLLLTSVGSSTVIRYIHCDGCAM
jgi:hypothetical protein